MQLKILSWNIWCDGNFEKVSEFLRFSDADIIGLQEVVPEDKGCDVISFLAGLGYVYAFAPACSIQWESRNKGRELGNAIFSKYPISATKIHILSVENRRVAVEVGIQFENTTLSVFSLHTTHTHQKESDIQGRQVENLIKILPKDRTVVMGDFNATPGMTSIKRMREVLVDTNPASRPTLDATLFDCKDCDPKAIVDTRLDYIFTSKDLKTNSPKVESPHGSDHLPISVMLKV